MVIMRKYFSSLTDESLYKIAIHSVNGKLVHDYWSSVCRVESRDIVGMFKARVDG